MACPSPTSPKRAGLAVGPECGLLNCIFSSLWRVSTLFSSFQATTSGSCKSRSRVTARQFSRDSGSPLTASPSSRQPALQYCLTLLVSPPSELPKTPALRKITTSTSSNDSTLSMAANHAPQGPGVDNDSPSEEAHFAQVRTLTISFIRSND